MEHPTLLLENIVEQLEKIKLFQGLKRSNIIELLDKTDYTLATYAENRIIQGRVRGLSILLTGYVDIKKNLLNGNLLLLRRVESPDIFGISSIFSENTKSENIIVTQTECSIMYLSENDIMNLFENSKDVLRNYLILIASKVDYLNKKIDILTDSNTSTKLLHYLLSLQNTRINGYVMLYITKKDLADLLHMGRTSLYRAFNKLEHDKVIRVKGNKIYL